MKVLVVSSDGHLVQPAQPSESGQELKITLPQPASLLVRYDIPGDPPDTMLGMTLRTREMEMPLWQGVNLEVSGIVPNHTQTLLTNLTPGTYDFRRMKSLRAEDGRGFTNSLDFQTILLGSGWTQQVNLVRVAGYPIQGELTLSDQAQVRPGFIFVTPSAPSRGSGRLGDLRQGRTFSNRAFGAGRLLTHRGSVRA